MTDPTAICWANYNGLTQPLDDVRIPALDRGFLFADSVYEVLRIHRGQLFRPAEHLARFQRSLSACRMTADLPLIAARLRDLLALHPVEFGIGYVQVTRGAARRTHRFPGTVEPNVLIWVEPLDPAALSSRSRVGIRAITHADLRWKRPDIKSNGLLANCLAVQAAVEQDATEAILIDALGHVTEGAASNVFAILDGTLATPALQSRILAGITRTCVLHLASQLGLRPVERDIRLDELQQADEIFLTSTTLGVTPVVALDNRPVADGIPGSTTRRLAEAFYYLLDEQSTATRRAA